MKFSQRSLQKIVVVSNVFPNFFRELSSHAFEMMHSHRIGNSLQKNLLSFKDTSIIVDNILGGNLDVVTRKSISFRNNVHPTFLRILSPFNGLLLVCNERI
ncbi:hypothetical protein Hanom_Chr09g00819261 [Helianthus anomalus]